MRLAVFGGDVSDAIVRRRQEGERLIKTAAGVGGLGVCPELSRAGESARACGVIHGRTSIPGRHSQEGTTYREMQPTLGQFGEKPLPSSMHGPEDSPR